MKTYPTDLTESQWQFIENIVDPNQRKRKYSLHEIMNALFYIAKSGTQWRMLPKDFAPWESVYYYFRKWKRDGLIEETHDVLVERIRTGIGKKPTPSVGIIDSQSVKACNVCEGDIGFDGVCRPDHVPTMEGDSNDKPGYSSLGRLFAIGYLRGLIQSIYSERATA